MAECPKCGAKVRKEKLRRHISGVHGVGAKVPDSVGVEPAKPISTVRFPWRAFAAMGVIAIVVIAGYWYFTQAPSGGPQNPPSGTKTAIMEVRDYGTIRITLDLVRAPQTAGNFMNLANAGSYNGKTFNRVCAGFVAQGGDVPGASQIPWEYSGLLNSNYSIAMARQGNPSDTYKDTASSSFFINLDNNTFLDTYTPPSAYPYVVFGRVDEGQSRAVVDAIASIPAGPQPSCPPNSPPVITSVTITG